MADWLTCSVRTVWQLIAEGKLTAIRMGRRATRVAADEVEKLIEDARARATR